jgi:hypothetical protein
MSEFQEQGNHKGSLLLCYAGELSVYGKNDFLGSLRP